jgi:hypothetical protein
MDNDIFFNGFKWPVPKEFADALAKCRFEEGDVLYSDACAYDLQWDKAKEKLHYSIQITSPMRSDGDVASSSSDGAFLSSWISPVAFELRNYKNGEIKRVNTLQGNLYMCLWEGDLSHTDSTRTPMLPLTISEIDKRLSCLEIEKNSESQFIMAFDPTNQILRTKRSKVEDALGENATSGSFSICSRSEFSGLKVLPTSEIVVFNIDMSMEDAEAAIKSAVYVPAKDKKGERDNFRIRSHGLLR